MAQPKFFPDTHQQELIDILRTAHRTLAVARKTKGVELDRRIAEEKLRLEGMLQQAEARIKLELDAEVVAHEMNLDDALIAAYNANIPVRTIAGDGFGNRYDGGVQQLLVKLRADGRVGSRKGWSPSEEPIGNAEFPSSTGVADMLLATEEVAAPTFSLRYDPVVLVEESAEGAGDQVTAPAVVLELDPRDGWFGIIAKNARKGTPYLSATSCTLYEHPATGEITAFESKETGEETWDHPVARWAKVHPEQTRAGFDAAIAAQ